MGPAVQDNSGFQRRDQGTLPENGVFVSESIRRRSEEEEELAARLQGGRVHPK